jgi:uncharacterized protein (TIRG00374 family)
VRRLLTRQNLGRAFSLLLVVGVFAFVLPRVADYGEVADAVADLSGTDIAILILCAAVNLLTFAPPWMAALPSLSMSRALIMSQASTAASSVLPGGDAIGLAFSFHALRVWGFSASENAVAISATGIWNQFANVGFAVVAVAGLSLTGESNPVLTTAAVIGVGALIVAVVAFALALHDEEHARQVGAVAERIANRGLRLIRRAPRSGWSEGLARFREHAVGLLRRRWLALTVATLLGHLTVFLVLYASLRTIGVTSSEVSFIEAFAAWSLIRIVTSIPITPGGLGIVELGLTGALVSFGGAQVEVVSAVLLYRVLTYVPPIAIGGICLLVWRRLPERETDEPSTTGEPSASSPP